MGKSPMKKKAAASSTRKANKKKMVPRKGARVDRRGLRWALQALLKEKGGRTDLKYEKVTKTHDKVMREVPIQNRAGYPLVFPKGSVDPKKWRTKEGKEVIVDFHRAKWLPDDWGQGVKCTNRIARSRGGGGTYTVIISPDGRVFYHRKAAEEHYGKAFSDELGFQGQVRLAKLKAKEAVQLVRLQIKEIPNRPKGDIRTDAAESLFKLLSPAERKCIPKASEFHFCVVSARRASSVEGVQDIFKVQCQFDEAGVVPTWYVDSDSVKEYRKLGLQAVEGGRLCPSRNKALKDANLLGKICVQASDDISAWEYRHGKRAASRDDALCNAAWAKAKRYVLSPLTAAQFIVAKMRGAPDPKPKLGGVYMLGSCSRTMAGEEFGTKHFILGDFFVVDTGSKVRFDENLNLKEDYDFTCSHIRAHGGVMRCNRMTLTVKHYSNSGGACSNRDKKGKEEQRNIGILMDKWPRALRFNPKRTNEVIMSWPTDDDAEGKHHEKRKPSQRPGTGKPGKTKAVAKKTKATRRKANFPSNAVILQTEKSKEANNARIKPYVARRCGRVSGKRVSEVLGRLKYATAEGETRTYVTSDLSYDLQRGFLKLKASKSG